MKCAGVSTRIHTHPKTSLENGVQVSKPWALIDAQLDVDVCFARGCCGDVNGEGHRLLLGGLSLCYRLAVTYNPWIAEVLKAVLNGVDVQAGSIFDVLYLAGAHLEIFRRSVVHRIFPSALLSTIATSQYLTARVLKVS